MKAMGRVVASDPASTSLLLVVLRCAALARKVDSEEASQCGLVSKLFGDKERRYELLL